MLKIISLLRKPRGGLETRLILSFSRVELLTVKSRHGEGIEAIGNPGNTLHYDPSLTPPIWCITFWFYRLLKSRDVPVEARSLVAICRAVRPLCVIATDAFRALHICDRFLRGTQFFWLQHGVFLPEEATWPESKVTRSDEKTSITLFSISEYDSNHYHRWGVQPKRIVPVGTLKSGLFANRRSSYPEREDWRCDISIVITSLRPEASSHKGRLRVADWKQLLNQLALYSQRYRPRITICLAPSAENDGVVEFIEANLEYPFLLANQSDTLSTYDAMAGSNLVVGVFATSLSEALGMKRKVLSVVYNNRLVPFDEATCNSLLVCPTEHQLSERIRLLSCLSWDDYWRGLSKTAKQLQSADPNLTLPRVRAEINRAIGHA